MANQCNDSGKLGCVMQKTEVIGGGRRAVDVGGQYRVATPMLYAETICTAPERDFLRRFCEAWAFSRGYLHALDADGKPCGRYAEHDHRVDPDAYMRFEVQAYDWVRTYGVGKEWAAILELFARMEAGETTIDILDWVSRMINSDNEAVNAGGAQLTMRYIGLRLKDAYQDFFRYYKFATRSGGKPNAQAFDGLEASKVRDGVAAHVIANYKSRSGLT